MDMIMFIIMIIYNLLLTYYNIIVILIHEVEHVWCITINYSYYY